MQVCSVLVPGSGLARLTLPAAARAWIRSRAPRGVPERVLSAHAGFRRRGFAIHHPPCMFIARTIDYAQSMIKQICENGYIPFPLSWWCPSRVAANANGSLPHPPVPDRTAPQRNSPSLLVREPLRGRPQFLQHSSAGPFEKRQEPALCGPRSIHLRPALHPTSARPPSTFSAVACEWRRPGGSIRRSAWGW